MDNHTKKLIQEYPEEYCEFLEAAYGKGMMSEGGSESIELMFDGLSLNHKAILDIGSGLGGMAYYLAEQYPSCRITGIELNPRMVQQANENIPSHLQNRIKFVTYGNAGTTTLPFTDSAFDVVASRGVFVHVPEKLPLFKEVYRVLKTGGDFIIDDWLSPYDNHWGERITKIREMEDLTLCATSEATYLNSLQTAGFKQIKTRDANPYYEKFNREIIHKLNDRQVKQNFIKQFSEADLETALSCYHLILAAIQDNELLNRWFSAKK